MKLSYQDDVKKIYEFRGLNVGLSYWGKAGFQDRTILQLLEEFERQSSRKSDDVDALAFKLTQYFQTISPKIAIGDRMGFHIAGYVENAPKLRHVFHESWHNAGEFTNEDCHVEYHIYPGNKVSYKERKDYPVLFNGDNLIANMLFNYSRTLAPYYSIVPHELKLDECVELAKLIISASIHRLNYYFDQSMERSGIPKTVGGPICIATITKETGLTLARYDPRPLQPLSGPQI